MKSIAKKIICTIFIIVVVIMLAANVFIYTVEYNEMFSMNKENMKLICNEIYENFKNLITIQINDVDKMSLDSDIKQLIMASNTTKIYNRK